MGDFFDPETKEMIISAVNLSLANNQNKVQVLISI